MYFAIWLLTGFLPNISNFYIILVAGAARSESVHTAKCHIPDVEGISLSSTWIMRHSSSVVVLFYSLAHYRMLLLLLTHLQCAYVFRASAQSPAIQALLPCSILLLACNYLSCFSYPFPKRLRHFFLFAFSQLSYVFSSHLFKIHHHNNPTCHHCLCHSNNLGAVIPRAAMETQALLKEFSGLLTCTLGACHLKLLSPCPVSYLIKGRR